MHRILLALAGAWVRRGNRQGGNAVVEFAVTLPFLLILGLGGFSAGVNLDRYLVMLQVTRSISHMYVRSVDFNATAIRNRVLDESGALQITEDGGPGAIYLSRVVLAESGSNAGLPCVAHRIRLGDMSFAGSKIAMPTTVCEAGTCEPASPDGTVVNWQNDPNAVADLPPGLTVTSTRSIFVGEVFHSPADLQSVFPGYFQLGNLYTRFFY